ncbi:MAG TPA: histidine kinase [Thermodesulfobacteriota bacterium]
MSSSRRALTWRAVLVAVAVLAATGAEHLAAPTGHLSLFRAGTAPLVAVLASRPSREWWAYLLVGAAARAAGRHLADAPTSLALTDALVTLLAAATAATPLVTLLGPWPGPRSLRSAAVYLVSAALAAPLLAAFAFAGIGAASGDAAAPEAFRPVFVGEAAAALTLTPLLLATRRDTFEAILRAGVRRYVEAALVAAGLAGSAAVAFGRGTAEGFHTSPLVYLPLPFLLWAAIRFRVTGAAAALLVVTLVAAARPVAGVEMFALALSVPLISLAALVEGRAGAEAAQRRSDARLRTVLESNVLPIVVWRADGRMTVPDDAHVRLLQCTCRELEAALRASEARYRDVFDSVAVAFWEEDFSAVRALVDSLPARGVTDLRAYAAGHPAFVRRALRKVRVVGVNEAAVRLFGARDKAGLVAAGGRLFTEESLGTFAEALVAIAEGRPGFETYTAARTLDGRRVELLLAVRSPGRQLGYGRVLLSAVDVTAHRLAVRRLKALEARVSSTLDALPAHIAILDETGTIVAVNRAWREFALANGFRGTSKGVGWNYLDVCRSTTGAEASEAQSVGDGIRAVMDGSRAHFRLEYACPGPSTLRWFQLRATRFFEDGRVRVVVAHENVTEIKLAERGLRALTGRLLGARDEERRRVARELHDGAAQLLVGVSINLERLRGVAERPDDTQGRLLDELADLNGRALKEIRTLSYLLHPPEIDALGLVAAIRAYVEGFTSRSDIEVAFVGPDHWERLPSDMETALFRIVQEALANVHRHSGSATARVELCRADGTVRLSVGDAGRGMPAEPGPVGSGCRRSVGVGIGGMRERVRLLGGRFEILSSGDGTTVSVVVPVPDGETRDLAEERAGRAP